MSKSVKYLFKQDTSKLTEKEGQLSAMMRISDDAGLTSVTKRTAQHVSLKP